ncbi:unnamed protein product, partial [marine sediment metagenome]
IVAFPTETVYGIGVNIFDEEAIKKIFMAKGRSFEKPLPAMVSSVEEVESLVEEINETARRIMNKYWPGPLTLIFKKKADVSLGSKEDTIAIRIPDHPITLALLKACQVPLAVTSANISGDPDTKSAAAVEKEIGDKIDLIIDGGPSPIGVPSTVLDVTETIPRVLRQGSVIVAVS